VNMKFDVVLFNVYKRLLFLVTFLTFLKRFFCFNLNVFFTSMEIDIVTAF